jgi:hypothetical protein
MKNAMNPLAGLINAEFEASVIEHDVTEIMLNADFFGGFLLNRIPEI